MERLRSQLNELQNGPNTFVFFDTEATGLPTAGNLPRFTELCFLAVSRQDLLAASQTPRVLNKITLCFNPEKRMNQSAIEISGLTNARLENSPTFDEQAPMLAFFLKSLPKPVCLVAHNGDRFDFPLLAMHLNDAGVDLSGLGDISCADSFKAFKAIFPMRSYQLGAIYRQVCGGLSRDTHSAEDDSRMLMEIVLNLRYPQVLARRLHLSSRPLSFFKCRPQDFCRRFGFD